MSVVGITPEEATAICDELSRHTEDMRMAKQAIHNHVMELDEANNISAGSRAYRVKFEGETGPNFDDVANRADAAIQGTHTTMRAQADRQEATASAINGI